MNKQILIDIVDIIKSMKTDIVLLTPDKIIGVDSNLSSVKVVNFITNIPYYYVFTVKNLIEYISSFLDQNLQFFPNSIGNLQSIQNMIEYIYAMYQRAIIPNIILQRYNNAHLDPEFNKLLTLKSGDGLGRYTDIINMDTNNKLFLSIFTGLIPINKSDLLDIEILDIDLQTFMAHLIIHKKKYDIHEYIKYKYL
jgi:hypothetical protein